MQVLMDDRDRAGNRQENDHGIQLFSLSLRTPIRLEVLDGIRQSIIKRPQEHADILERGRGIVLCWLKLWCKSTKTLPTRRRDIDRRTPTKSHWATQK